VPFRSAPARLRAAFFGLVVTVTDLLPPRLRYGYVHRLSKVMFARPLPVVGSAISRSVAAPEAPSSRTPGVTCAILADRLDVGGIGAVIEMLAREFDTEGVHPVVICHGDGERAHRLRQLGIDVRSVTDLGSAIAALAACRPDVLQTHSAPQFLERAAMASLVPIITVMHNTEIHYTPGRWKAFATLMEHSAAGIAVSDTVREYHARQLEPQLARLITVIVNGAPALLPATADERVAARLAVGRALGITIGSEVLFVCLARYDSQKNIAGATIAFARAARQLDGIHLIFAGDPSDWAELRRAQALRDVSGGRRRIHFLGNSDAATLLTAGDVFLLDSFFEGWPVAATEASAVGLPLILSDVGGASELVARDPDFSIMTPNPAGDAAGINDGLVRRARRRTRSQSGADALVAAIITVAARVAGSDSPLAPRSPAGVAAMVREHARVLRDTVRRP
jgi:glycosyltransferase involved in cell wall biosynthesis